MTTSITPSKVSSYRQYLPAVYQQTDDFLGRFLLAFEHILSGLGDAELPGLEEIIDSIDLYFDPEQTRNDFLGWLAGWVALTLRDDWDEGDRRRFLSRIVPLYRQRGTKAGLIEMVKTYTGFDVQVQDLPFQLGVRAMLGKETLLTSPHHFHVTMILRRKEGSDAIARKLKRIQEIALAIIDQEKPAHTHYSWQILTPTMQIGTYSHVGIDTFLGNLPPEGSPQN